MFVQLLANGYLEYVLNSLKKYWCRVIPASKFFHLTLSALGKYLVFTWTQKIIQYHISY